MIIYDFDPNNIPDEFLRAIGRVILSASQVEDTVRTAIGVFLGIDNIETLALTNQLSTPLKDKILRAVAELNAGSASAVDDLDDILDKIGDQMAERNAIAHKSLCRDPENGEVLMWKEKVKGSVELELQPITSDDLNTLADSLLQSSNELTEFTAKLGGPNIRTIRLREPLKRTKTARAQRRAEQGTDY